MNFHSILNLFNMGLSSAALPRWKRLLDLTAILLTLPLTVPVGAGIAALIKVLSPGPVLFRQPRVGFLGGSFMCLKFRTMVVGADTSGHHNHLSTLMVSDAPMVKLDARGDARIIPLGIFLRSSGLDELPQLVNVLLGEMSLVGPRPCLPYESERYLPWQRERFNTLPGLTGLWQVNGKNKTTFLQMMQMDIDYGRNRTLGLDLLILFKTPLVVLGQVCEVLARKAGFNGDRAHPRAAAPFHSSYPRADVQPTRGDSQAGEISKQA
jgi:lipopolysaccharide/colanic/teichoic acid biosynthesis glycosyltransferase